MVEFTDRVLKGGSAIEQLCTVASDGNLEAVIRLLGLGHEVNGAREDGCTPLQRAACEGHIDVINYLIEFGANINTQDCQLGNTPLHEASWKGYSETSEILLKAKANVDMRNFCGFAPLHLACQNGHNQTCRVLLLGGAKADLKNNYGDTSLHTAARYGHAGVTRILLSANANIKEVNKNGDTALHIATAMGRKKLTKMLLEAASDQTAKNKQNETSLDIATRKCFLEVIEILCNPPPIISPAERMRREMQQNDSNTKKNFSKPDKRREKITDSGTSSKDSGTKKKDKKKLKSESKIDPKTREARILNWGVEWSPYGCHVDPSPQNKITSANLNTIPTNPLSTGEQYFVDLAGNIKKGPVGVGSFCICAPLIESVQDKMERDKFDIIDHIDVAHGKLGARISSLETETRGKIQELGDSFNQKIAEEGEKCRIRSYKFEKSREDVLSDTISEMKSWVESRLSFHHPDSPQSFRHKIHRGRNHAIANRENQLKRSKSVETFSDILQLNEEPLYRGLCILDYPTSLHNISRNVSLNETSELSCSSAQNHYTNMPPYTSRKHHSLKSLCTSNILNKEIDEHSNHNFVFYNGKTEYENEHFSTNRDQNFPDDHSVGKTGRYAKDIIDDTYLSKVNEPEIYLESRKSKCEVKGPQKVTPYRFNTNKHGFENSDCRFSSKENLMNSQLHYDCSSNKQDFQTDRSHPNSNMNKGYKENYYENKEKSQLDETILEMDSHNDSGYSTRLCSSSQLPSPSLAFGSTPLINSQLHNNGYAASSVHSRWNVIGRNLPRPFNSFSENVKRNETTNSLIKDQIGKSSLV